MKYLVLCAMLSAGMVFASCGDEEEDDDLTPNNSTEQNNGQNNQNNNGDSGNNNGNGGQTNNNGQTTDDNGNQENNATSGSLADFYDKFPVNLHNMEKYIDATNYDALKALVPAGIYTFAASDDENPKIFVKGTDGSAMIFYPERLDEETNYIGNILYYNGVGDDGKNSSYMFYNDQFGERKNYEPAPSILHQEYDSRAEMLRPVTNILDLNGSEESKALSIMDWMLEGLFPGARTHLLMDELGCKLHSEGETTLNGIKCNYYYITYEGSLPLYESTAPEKLQEWWLTDDFVCLQYKDWDNQYEQINTFTLISYLPAGTFEENYQTVAKNYNHWGEHKLSETLYSHKKYGDYWLSDEYPASINNWLIKYNGKKSSFEISRRAWVDTDNIVNITIKAYGTTRQEALDYIKEVKELNLPDVYNDAADQQSIHYNAADEDAGKIYPSYDIIFTEYGDGQTYFSISFDLVRSISV